MDAFRAASHKRGPTCTSSVVFLLVCSQPSTEEVTAELEEERGHVEPNAEEADGRDALARHEGASSRWQSSQSRVSGSLVQAAGAGG